MHTPHLNLAARIQRPLLDQALMDGGLVTARIRVTVGLAIPTPWRGSRATVGPLPALPLSAGGSGAPATGCAPSHTPPLFFQKGPRRPPGRRGVPSSSAGRGRSMGLRRGFLPA